jgi:hypothetical protein
MERINEQKEVVLKLQESIITNNICNYNKLFDYIYPKCVKNVMDKNIMDNNIMDKNIENDWNHELAIRNSQHKIFRGDCIGCSKKCN